MIKAVLFDMDGILFDTEIVMKEGWLKAARELNFTLTEEHSLTDARQRASTEQKAV